MDKDVDRAQLELARRQGETERAQFEKDRFQRELDRWRAEENDDERVEAQQLAFDRAQAAADRLQAAMDRQQAAIYKARADNDELTGTLRRGAGVGRVVEEIERARRGKTSLAIVFVDVDGLKRVNDTDGHAAGDRLLVDVAAGLEQGLRVYDVVIRYGGDEFLCALPGTTAPQAEERFQEIAEELAQRESAASISTGFAELAEGDSAEHLIERADADLYRRRAIARASSVRDLDALDASV